MVKEFIYFHNTKYSEDWRREEFLASDSKWIFVQIFTFHFYSNMLFTLYFLLLGESTSLCTGSTPKSVLMVWSWVNSETMLCLTSTKELWHARPALQHCELSSHHFLVFSRILYAASFLFNMMCMGMPSLWFLDI